MLMWAAIAGAAWTLRNIRNENAAAARADADIASNTPTTNDVTAAIVGLHSCLGQLEKFDPETALNTNAAQLDAQIKTVQQQIAAVEAQVEAKRASNAAIKEQLAAQQATLKGLEDTCQVLADQTQSKIQALSDSIQTTSDAATAKAASLRQAMVPALTKRLQCEDLLRRTVFTCPALQRNATAWSDVDPTVVADAIAGKSALPTSSTCGYWGKMSTDAASGTANACVMDVSNMVCPQGTASVGGSTCCPVGNISNGKCTSGACTIDYTQIPNMPFCRVGSVAI